MILLRTSANNKGYNNLIILILINGWYVGSCFIKTDQLDGETDWKLRTSLPLLQQLQSDEVSVLHVHKYC